MTPLPRQFDRLVLEGRLAGRTALISGGAGGMGRAASRMFAHAGAHAAILDILEEAGAALAQEICRAGGAAVRAAIALTVDIFGPIDTLFSDAGTIIVTPLHETTDADHDRLLRQRARSIAVESRDRGIRANAICPGFVKTDHGLCEIAEPDGLGQNWDEADQHAVQGRICEPEEVAAAAVFLAPDEASFINGFALYVDNGWYAKG